MDNQNPQQNYDNSGQFELTDQQIQAHNFWSRVKYYVAAVEPAFGRVLNTIFYWTIKFVKSFVGSLFKMILGKEI